MIVWKSRSRMSSWTATLSSLWKTDPVLASSVTFYLHKAPRTKNWPTEKEWNKDDVGHSPFWRGQTPYLTQWIQLRENAERCLWKNRESFTWLLIQDKLLISFHKDETAFSHAKARHSFNTWLVSILHWILRSSEEFSRKSLWSHSLQLPGPEQVQKECLLGIYSCKMPP